MAIQACSSSNQIIMIIYVYDIIIVRKDDSMLEKINSRYNIGTTTNPRFLLNIKLSISANSIKLSQPAVVEAILRRFHL